MNIKIKLLILFNHVAAIYALTQGQYYWLLLSLVTFVFINKLGGEIGLHRYFCHKSFETSRFWHYTMLIAASLNCFGPPMAWVGVHRKHHAASDTDEDPHGNQSLLRIWTTFWKPFNIEIKYFKDMLKDRDQMFVYKYYFPLIISFWLFLFFIDWRLPIFAISIPSMISFHLAGLVNSVCHVTGDRPFETKDHSYNNKSSWIMRLDSNHHMCDY